MPTNNIIVNDDIARIALPHFINNCKMLRLANHDYEKDIQGLSDGYKRGDTIRIQLPSYYPVTQGEIANPIGINEFTDTLVLQYQLNVTFETSSTYLTTNMEDYERRAVMPAGIGLANQVDTNCILEMGNTLFRASSTLGSPVNSFASFNNSKTMLKKYAVQAPYFALMNEDDGAALQNALQNNFNYTLNEEIGIEGILGKLAGVEVYDDQNMQTHQQGVNTGTPTVTTAGQLGSTITTTGWTANTTNILLEGDLITFAGVYGLNPVPPNSQIGTASGPNNLAVFRVTANVSSVGSGNATIPISPALSTIASNGVYATASNSPASGAAVNVLANTVASNAWQQNFMFNRSCCTLAVVPLRRPPGAVNVGMYTDPKTGVSLRVIDGYDIITNQEIKRMDILFGVKVFPNYGIMF